MTATNRAQFELFLVMRLMALEYMYGNKPIEWWALFCFIWIVLVGRVYGAARYHFTGEMAVLDLPEF